MTIKYSWFIWLLTLFPFTLKEGLTPYNYAEQNGNSEMMRLLKEEQRNAERSNKSSTCVILWPSHLRMSILLCRHLRKKLTALPVLFLRVVQYRCVLHMREMLMTLFLSLNLRVGVPMFSCIYLSINTQIVSLCIWLLLIIYLFLLHTSHYIHMWYFFIIYSTILFYDIRYFIINYLFL